MEGNIYKKTLLRRGVNEVIRYYLRRLGKSDNGAAMVEFALIALLLLALIFGIIEFGWILNGYITLTFAVREGARLAVVSDVSDENEIKDLVVAYASTFDIERSDVSVSWASENVKDTTVSVVQGKLPLIVGFFPFIDNPFRLSAEASMRQE